MKSKTVLNQIKVLLGMAVKLSESKLKDGTIVVFDELAIGSNFLIKKDADTTAPAPAGEYELEDGTIVVIGEDNLITEIKEPEKPADELPAEDQMEEEKPEGEEKEEVKPEEVVIVVDEANGEKPEEIVIVVDDANGEKPEEIVVVVEHTNGDAKEEIVIPVGEVKEEEQMQESVETTERIATLESKVAMLEEALQLLTGGYSELKTDLSEIAEAPAGTPVHFRKKQKQEKSLLERRMEFLSNYKK